MRAAFAAVGLTAVGMDKREGGGLWSRLAGREGRYCQVGLDRLGEKERGLKGKSRIRGRRLVRGGGMVQYWLMVQVFVSCGG